MMTFFEFQTSAKQNLKINYFRIFQLPILFDPTLSIIPFSCKLSKVLAIVLFESFVVSDKEFVVLVGLVSNMLTTIDSFAVNSLFIVPWFFMTSSLNGITTLIKLSLITNASLPYLFAIRTFSCPGFSV